MSIRTRVPSVVVTLLLLTLLIPSLCLPAESTADFSAARRAVQESMATLGMNKNDSGFLLLTNAAYGQINGQGAEPYRDLLSESTGCTIGKHSLLDIHTAFNTPLWFSLFQKGTNKLVFCTFQNGAFQRQTIQADPDKILDAQAWKQASRGLIGKKALFQVVSISLAWSADAAWPILKTAGFHDHVCPGVNIGYLVHQYLEKSMPLEKGDRYLFFGALPKCYMDTLQVVYNATMGKQMAYGITMTQKQLAAYKTKGSVPSIIALKVNKGKDICQGIVLGFSWKQIMDDLGLRVAEFAPKEGPANPIFFVTRAKACWKMAQMKPEQKMRWLVEMRRFSGPASLAKRVCNAGGDPYGVVWAK